MAFNPKRFLTEPPAAPADWAREMPVEDLPVISRTAYVLEDLREFEEQVELQMLDDLIAADPLMTAKLFGFTSKQRSKDTDGEAESVRQALLLLGTAPFFRALGSQLAVEDLLAGEPEALNGFHQTLDRARRAGRSAGAFACQRDDPDAALVHQAAVLYSLPELVVWLRAPALALEVARRRESDPGADQETLQKSVLNATYGEIRLELLKAWRLPRQIAQLISGQAGLVSSPQSHIVRLALKAAQPDQPNWESAALGTLVREIGDFLQLGLQHTRTLMKNLEQPEVSPL
jgi:HD-like signal output (HDOD) protein